MYPTTCSRQQSEDSLFGELTIVSLLHYTVVYFVTILWVIADQLSLTVPPI